MKLKDIFEAHPTRDPNLVHVRLATSDTLGADLDMERIITRLRDAGRDLFADETPEAKKITGRISKLKTAQQKLQRDLEGINKDLRILQKERSK